MYENQFTSPLRPLALAILTGLAAAVVSPAFAGEDDSPLSLTLSDRLMRDSNIGKNQSNQADTINTTSVTLGLDKSYGRQNYKLAATAGLARYSRTTDLNSDSKNLNGSFSTEIMRNWIVRANGLYDEGLNQIQNNQTNKRLEKNIRKYRDGGFSVQYGNGGTWAIAGTHDGNKTSYSLQDADNTTQDSNGLRAIYLSSDALSFSFGGRNVKTIFPNRSNSNQTDKDIDLSSDWQITGLSMLNATLTKTRTSTNQGQAKTVGGWGGSLSWAYTPHGLMSYNLQLNRSRGTDRRQGLVAANVGFFQVQDTQYGVTDTLTNSLVASAKLQATAKVSFSSSLTLVKYQQQDNNTYLNGRFAETSAKSKSEYGAGTFGLAYAATRFLNTGCSYSRYGQSRQLADDGNGTVYEIRPKFIGYSFDCNVSFTLN